MTGCGCDECVAGNPCIPVFTPVPVLYSQRVCRHCGGATVETGARRRFIGWDSSVVPRVARYAGVVRRRFWCGPCERVTS